MAHAISLVGWLKHAILLFLLWSCRGAKAASLASGAAEQPASTINGMTLRHASTAAAELHAADTGAHTARAAPRVHRSVVRESDMRKFAGQVSTHTAVAVPPFC